MADDLDNYVLLPEEKAKELVKCIKKKYNLSTMTWKNCLELKSEKILLNGSEYVVENNENIYVIYEKVAPGYDSIIGSPDVIRYPNCQYSLGFGNMYPTGYAYPSLKRLEFYNLKQVYSRDFGYNQNVPVLFYMDYVVPINYAPSNFPTIYVKDDLVADYKKATNWTSSADNIKGLSEYV